jgi:hypothetical protein
MPPDLAKAPALADAIAVTPDDAALLISNPADDKIYFYIEGAQSAAGGYQGHTLVPRAVQIADRSLKERSPGVYTGGIRIPRSGDFTVAFMLTDPQVVHCFQFTAKPNPELAEERASAPPQLEFVMETREVKAGETLNVQFTLTDRATGQAISGLEDMLSLAHQTAGNWSQRYVAQSLEDGLYEIAITVPNPGLYTLYFAIPSLQVNPEALPSLHLKVTAD